MRFLLVFMLVLPGCREKSPASSPVDKTVEVAEQVQNTTTDASIASGDEFGGGVEEAVNTRPGPPGSIVPWSEGPPWPAAGVTVKSADGKQSVVLSLADGMALQDAVQKYLQSPALAKAIENGAIDGEYRETLAAWQVGPPMADGPRISRWLLTVSEWGTLELTATLQVRAHHRYDLSLAVQRLGKAFQVKKARGRLTDGGDGPAGVW